MKEMQDEIDRLKEACEMLREDRDTWQASYMWINEGRNEVDETIEKLMAEIERKDEHLKSAKTYCEEGMPLNAIGHIEQALTKPEEDGDAHAG